MRASCPDRSGALSTLRACTTLDMGCTQPWNTLHTTHTPCSIPNTMRAPHPPAHALTCLLCLLGAGSASACSQRILTATASLQRIPMIDALDRYCAANQLLCLCKPTPCMHAYMPPAALSWRGGQVSIWHTHSTCMHPHSEHTARMYNTHTCTQHACTHTQHPHTHDNYSRTSPQSCTQHACVLAVICMQVGQDITGTRAGQQRVHCFISPQPALPAVFCRCTAAVCATMIDWTSHARQRRRHAHKYGGTTICSVTSPMM